MSTRERNQHESLVAFANRMNGLLERMVGPSPDPALRAVATILGQAVLELADQAQEAHRRIDALLAAETLSVKQYEGLRSGQETMVERLDDHGRALAELEQKLARTDQLASRAALHSVPFGGATESPGPLMPERLGPVPEPTFGDPRD